MEDRKMGSVPDATINEGGFKTNIWKGEKSVLIVGSEDIGSPTSVRIGPKVLEALARQAGFKLIANKELKKLQKQPTPSTPGLVAVQYVGRREPQAEPQFGTGFWDKQQVKNVPLGTAIKLLKEYPGVFQRHEPEDAAVDSAFKAPPVVKADLKKALGVPEKEEVLADISSAATEAEPAEEAEETPEVKAAEEPLAQAELQHARYMVATLDVQGLRDYAQQNFGQKLHHKIGLEKAKTQVVQMIDQYGLP
jgi:hypothetical protein